MTDSMWAIRVCRYIKRAMFLFCRYPVFSAQYIRNQIDRPDTDLSELQDYRENLVTVKRVRAVLLVAVYISYTIKNLYVLYAWTDSYDFENHQDNLKPLSYEAQQLNTQMNYSLPADTLKHISCVYTNCTQLGPPDLAERRIDEHTTNISLTSSGSLSLLKDVARLPVLALCWPTLERFYYTPTTKLGSFGIYAFFVTMYTHILLGSWTSIQQMLKPATGDLIMTVTSPKVTTKVMRLHACELLRDLAMSLQNYRLFSIWNHTSKSLTPQMVVLAEPGDADKIICRTSSPSSNDSLSDFKKSGSSWRPFHLRAARLVTAQPIESETAEKKADGASAFSSTHQERLVDPTLRDFYFRNKSEFEIRRAIDNCMPVVYTDWWRPRLAKIWATVTLQTLFTCGLVGLSCYVYVGKRVLIEKATVREFARQTERRNCFVWHETVNSFTPDQAIQLNQLHYDWDFFSILDAGTLSYLGGVTLTLLFAHYWALVSHIGIWLAEMRMFIVASLLATRFQHQRDRMEAESDLYDDDADNDQHETRGQSNGSASAAIGRHHLISTRQFYNVPNLRQQFQQSTWVTHIYIFKKIQRRDKWTFNITNYLGENDTQPKPFDYHLLNSKHSDRNYAERFLAEILFPLPANIGEQPDKSAELFDKIDYDVETMEQMYINFRLFVSYVHSLNSSMRVLITVGYLLNYGYILVSIICRRKFSNLNEETIFLAVVAFLITNYLIYLGADFHANAKQVQPLLWSLIAQLTYSKSLRVQHLRSLWIKQTVQLDGDGGLALTAYGVPITYVYIIQLVIWTATIFVLALKPHGQEG